jgi:integrase
VAGHPGSLPPRVGRGRGPLITVHGLRHTHATLLIAAGVPVKIVSERLGHASVSVTLTYHAHSMPGDQKRAASRFAALIGEA